MMLCSILLCLVYLVLSASVGEKKDKYRSGNNTDQKEALKFLQEYNNKSLQIRNRAAKANWNYAADLTDANKKKMLKMRQVEANFEKRSWENATSFAWKDLEKKNPTAYRMFKRLSILGTAALPKDKLKELHEIVADMQDIYSKAKVCGYNCRPDKPCNLSLEPEVSYILANSRNYGELTHVWAQWRDASGKKMKKKFLKYLDLYKEVAKLNGFSDGGELWREAYEHDKFQEDIIKLWKTIEPLYLQLHAYVRRKLRERYNFDVIKADGPIPAHLLGNMWGQSWSNIFDIVAPYPRKDSCPTEAMKKRNMTELDMFKMSEDFFTSLGLNKMTPEFWNRSIIVKPKNKEMVCHASAWDFSDGKDFRIKMCTELNMEELIVVHHEMGHIEYYQQYAHQPAIFRGGANPGFHEAIGDTIALSVSTPEHLRKIGLLGKGSNNKEAEINSLLNTALSKIAFLPFGYLIDAWRWKLFDGSIRKKEMNQKWWEMRLKYQGLCPPVRRTNDDFDAASKYHVGADEPYISYFVSGIIQFQFHKALCKAADHKGPLHKCDIYKNKKAGKLLRDMLSMGSSKHWEAAMSNITHGKTSKMDTGALIEYFKPLMDWLKEQNKYETLGWTSSDPMSCP